MSYRTTPLSIIAGLLALALLASSAVRAQDKKPNVVEAVLSTPRMNIMYRGLENPIQVAIPGEACEDLVVSVSSGSISGSGCSYTVKPGKESEVTFTIRTRSGKHAPVTLYCSVRKVPDPIAFFGGMNRYDDSLYVRDAMAAQGVLARIPDLECPPRSDVIGYRLILERDRDIIFDGVSTEPKRTEDMRNALLDARPNDRLRIENIRAKSTSGDTLELGSLFFRLYQ